jgi:hypothetical protein
VTDVAGKQHRHAAEPELEHDRIVVADLLALPVRRGRVVDAQLDAAKREAIAALKRSPAGASLGRGLLEAPGCFVVGDRHSLPRLRRRERAHQRQRAADVIGVAVSNDEIVKAGDRTRPQRRAEHAVADIEAPAHRDAAGVDHEPSPVGKLDQSGVALANIHHRQPKAIVAALAGKSRRRDRDPRKQHRG